MNFFKVKYFIGTFLTASLLFFLNTPLYAVQNQNKVGIQKNDPAVVIVDPLNNAIVDKIQKLDVVVYYNAANVNVFAENQNQTNPLLQPVKAVELLLNGERNGIREIKPSQKEGDATFSVSFSSLPQDVTQATLQARIYTNYEPELERKNEEKREGGEAKGKENNVPSIPKPNMPVAESDIITVLFPTLITKTETVGLSVLQNNNIPLKGLVVSTFLSENIMAIDQISASVTVADADKGQIVFISDTNGNPFVVAYIPAFDIQNGTTDITLDSIADGFIMVNPLMFGFKNSDRLAILAYAKNTSLYQNLKNEINVALQTEPYNLLEEAIFPNTYGDATLLVVDALKNIGGEDLTNDVVKAILNVTPAVTVGQTNVPHLNDLGSGNIETINPTMVFYGLNIAEQPEQTRVISGKETLWDLNLGWVWPPIDPQFTDPVKEVIPLGDNGHFNITFSKFGLSDKASKMASGANVLRGGCIVLDVLFMCNAKNKDIERFTESADDDSLGQIAIDIWNFERPEKIIEKVVDDILLNKKIWPIITRALYGSAADKEAAVGFLKGSKKILKATIVVVKVLNAYDAANVYVPFFWDGIIKPTNVKYCVTETDGVLSATCQMIPPTAIITMTTPTDQTYAGREVIFDASSSFDPIYSTDSLMVRWDFNNDGIYEIDWSATKTASWIYGNEGIYVIGLQVKNRDGPIGQTIYTAIINALTAGGTANHIKAFRDVRPWNTVSFETTMANNGYTEGTGEKQYEILPSTALATNLLIPEQDFVIIMNDQDQMFYNNIAAGLSRLDRFVQNGGSVLWEAADLGWNGGSMDVAGIQTLPGGVQFAAKYDHTNYNENPSSALMNGLPDTLNGSYASHEHFMNLPDEATIYMTDTANYPTLAEYRNGSGWMVITGQPLEYNVVYDPNSMGLIYPRLFNYVLGQSLVDDNLRQMFVSATNSSDQTTQNIPPSYKEE